jgi:hypothetical protein
MLASGNIITITKKAANLPRLWISHLGLLVVVSLICSNRLAWAADETSVGPLFERFNLALEEGYRTEVAGPLYYFQQAETATTWAFPPFFSCYRDPAVESHEDDFLYPLFTSIHYGQERRWQFFQLLSAAGGQQQSGDTESRFTLFPLYFQQRSTDTNKNYTALAPFYGHLQNRLFHDRIFFVMFPIYSETQKRDFISDNYLYPFVNVRHGDGLYGWGVWPFYGTVQKLVTWQTNGFGDVSISSGYERTYTLWPLWLNQHNNLGTENPETFKASIPLFVYQRSPQLDLTTVIWPFFTWIDNRGKQYREWQMPWPIVIFARGEGKTTSRVFPFFQRSHNATLESDFYLWPVYTYKRTHSDPLDFQRTRVAFYLYANVKEKNTQTGKQKQRLDMWPFFTWHKDFNGNSRLQVLAPLEPLLPNNDRIERNWSPLWSLWREWDNPGTQTSSHSLLWNLYRDEQAPEHKKISLLFGFFQYQCDGAERKIRLFYIPVSKTSASAK